MRRLGFAAVSLLSLALACSNSPDDGGTGGGMDGGTDGGTNAGTDGGADGGLVITNPGGGTTVNLTFGTCSGFSACGGDEHGTWDYTAACISEDYLTELRQACAGATLKSSAGTKKGTVLISGSGIARDVVTTVTLVITIPGSCTTPLGGCTGVQASLQQAFPGATCAAGGAGACDCNATRNTTIRDVTTYTKSGSRITVSNGDTYDFCVSGTAMTYMEGGRDAVDGVFEMKKR